MKNEFNLRAIAYKIKTIQDQCGQIEPLTSQFENFGNSEAYAVADQIHEMRMKEGAVPVGRKIGFTNPEMWSLYGVREPIWSYIYNTTVVQLSNSKTQCSIGKFAEPKIEPEIVVHFGSAPPLSASVTEVLASIDWIAHGIEIVQSHFPGWKFQAADTIADWGLHATLIVGKPHLVEELGANMAVDIENFTVQLSCGDEVREQGKGSNALGSPLKAVAHLIGVIAKQPHAPPLRAGEMVTTGTLTAALSVFPGQTWRTDLKGISLSGISVSFNE